MMTASAMCTVHVRARVIKPRTYGVHVPGTEQRKELARLQKRRQSRRERDDRGTRCEQPRMHQQTSRARETSQRRSVNYDKYIA